MKRFNITITSFILISLFVGGLLLSECNTASEVENADAENVMQDQSIINDSKCNARSELKIELRKLWEDHVAWTRNVMLNIIDDLPGKDEAVKRLLKNQDDIGDAMKPFYGEKTGEDLTKLLHTHIFEAGDLLKAIKINDKIAIDNISIGWYENADSIAELLCHANPNWNLVEMKTMMHKHLEITTEEALARKRKDYNGDIAAYDKVRIEIAKMSDMFYYGILDQFPEKIK
jgi:hypothetical protein